ncbi:Hypothetical protein R9X50_00118300 [Acrodontium crateriforme]|uniref:MARVEL domain-containing protein n=1 Tax=Acrodontium crateriforme TaxID=150365 RepID=A0AAQ3R5L0_9PEZI|nr:Hypothetical protein R9X50_00118300 [Acrodontium crateriforme]
MLNQVNRSARTAPSQYPRIPFHGLRTVQFISSAVVGSVVTFFTWHLHHDGYSMPWVFIWLASASFFSVLALGFTIVLHCFIGLNPRVNLAINSFLALLWCFSWFLLTWYMRGTLAHHCDIETWKENDGMMVCRYYKALFSFTLFGTISTIGALILDVYVFRTQTRRGVYRQTLHALDPKLRPKATRGPLTDDDDTNTKYTSGGFDTELRERTTLQADRRPSMGPYGEQSEQMLADSGYRVPEQQFAYDTGYHGGHKDSV